MAIILRPYQEQLKADIYSEWNSGHKNVLAVMATGLGKTKTFCSIAVDMAISMSGPRFPTAIMVHRKELVQQISLTLAEEGITHNIIAPRPVILGIVASHRQVLKKNFYDYNAPITVISVDTLNKRIKHHEKWAKSIMFWITDEAAHVLRENKWGRAIAYFPNAVGLGVTATPRRLDKRGLGRHADGVFDVKVEGPSTRWGIDNGYLCKYKIVVPPSDYENYLEKAHDGSDYSRKALAVASAKSHIVGDVVENYIKWVNGKQAIVFTSDIDAGTKMEKKFAERGVVAKLLTSETDDKERLLSLIDYKEKKIQVLINIDLFDEGLDVPGIEAVIMARKTMSTAKFLQMCGRGLRPDGDKVLYIIDHVGNIGIGKNTLHGLPDAYRKWTLDRIVKRQDRTNLLRFCANPRCNAPYDRILTECPHCQTVPDISGGGGGGIRPTPEHVDGDLYLLDPDMIRQLEAGTQLEDPAEVARRVGAVAGGPAGIRAMKNQIERRDVQKELAEAIAKWAGKQRRQGYSDRHIHKIFWLQFDKTITIALSEPTAEMRDTLDELGQNHREYQLA